MTLKIAAATGLAALMLNGLIQSLVKFTLQFQLLYIPLADAIWENKFIFYKEKNEY